MLGWGLLLPVPHSQRRFQFPPKPYFTFLLSEEGLHLHCLEKMGDAFSFTAQRQLWQMLAAITFFHISEYVLAIIIHGRRNVSLSSLLISKRYIFALTCSLLEYMVEIVLFPELKEHWWISNIGLAMILIGEVIRKAAIGTAREAFTHVIRIYYADGHELVMDGIYRFIRHPGYSGFFIWATGMQIMLCNPLCTFAFAVVMWKFFSRRIPYEEFFLRQFFGAQYIEYARKVHSGLPFIK